MRLDEDPAASMSRGLTSWLRADLAMKTLVQVGGEGTEPRYDSSQEQEAGRDSCGREAFKGPH